MCKYAPSSFEITLAALYLPVTPSPYVVVTVDAKSIASFNTSFEILTSNLVSFVSDVKLTALMRIFEPVELSSIVVAVKVSASEGLSPTSSPNVKLLFKTRFPRD